MASRLFSPARQGEGGPPLSGPAYSDRAMTAAATFERVSPHLPAFGITRLGRLTGLDTIGIPVWQAVSPNARSIVIHHGKGITDIDAKVSAAMEALERAFAACPAAPGLTASRSALAARGLASDPMPALIARGEHDIGREEEIAWLAGRDLIGGSPVHVPRDSVLLDRTLGRRRFWQSSDGLASGNTLDEALLHGLLERIERDAEMLWMVSDVPTQLRACVDPTAFGDAVLDRLAAMVEDAGFALRLFDVTSDVGIPVIAAQLAPRAALQRRTAHFVEVTGGCGAHPSPARAAIRAVTEAAQSRLTFISGARDDIAPETYDRLLPAEIRARFEAVPGRLPTESLAGPLPGDAGALLEMVVDRLRDAQVGPSIAVPLSDPALPFAVAKLLVPGLENPEGARKRRFGVRALAKSLALP